MDEQKADDIVQITFDGDELLAVVRAGEGVAVPVRLICDALGLDLRRQGERLREHEVLRQGLRKEILPIDGRAREVVVILHRYIPFWLATIVPGQVNAESRPKLIRYQTELVDVLASIYLAPAPQDPRAVERRFAEVLSELRRIGAVQGNQEQRLTLLEHVVDEMQSQSPINAQQQEYIKRTIQRIARTVQEREQRDIFGKLFGQFCLDLGTPRYDALPAARYDAAVRWLEARSREYLGTDEALPPHQEPLL